MSSEIIFNKLLEEKKKQLKEYTIDILLSMDEAKRKEYIQLNIDIKSIEEYTANTNNKIPSRLKEILIEKTMEFMNNNDWKNLSIYSQLLDTHFTQLEKKNNIQSQLAFDDYSSEQMENIKENNIYVKKEEETKRVFRRPTSIKVSDSGQNIEVEVQVLTWREALQHLALTYRDKFVDNGRVQKYAHSILNRKSVASILSAPDKNDFDNALKKMRLYTSHDLIKNNNAKFEVEVNYDEF